VAGGNALLRVTASGTAPLSYQWSFNGIAFPSATNSVLAMTNVQQGKAGNYRVLVTNPGGAITSSVATLTVTAPATASAIVLAPSGTAAMTPNGFAFHLSVTSGSTYVIEASSDLHDWIPIATNVAASSSVVFTDTSASNYGSRWYRARTP
jgi:hypothetical protein